MKNTDLKTIPIDLHIQNHLAGLNRVFLIVTPMQLRNLRA